MGMNFILTLRYNPSDSRNKNNSCKHRSNRKKLPKFSGLIIFKSAIKAKTMIITQPYYITCNKVKEITHFKFFVCLF